MEKDKVVWLVAGNKGGAGKSVVAKALVDWLQSYETPVMVVDGDKRTPDVHGCFATTLSSTTFDLSGESDWAAFADFLCASKFNGHVVTNLPDGITESAIGHFSRLAEFAQNFDFTVKVVFVLNALPDGLALFSQLIDSFEDVYPCKNLHFGSVADFHAFDAAFSVAMEGKIIYFPKMPPKIMTLVRESTLSYSAFMNQSGDAVSNFSYAKIVCADWRDSVIEAFNEILIEG